MIVTGFKMEPPTSRMDVFAIVLHQVEIFSFLDMMASLMVHLHRDTQKGAQAPTQGQRLRSSERATWSILQL